MTHALTQRSPKARRESLRQITLVVFFALLAFGAATRIVHRTGLSGGWPAAELITMFAAGVGAGAALVLALRREP
jgi:hypothetical protein